MEGVGETKKEFRQIKNLNHFIKTNKHFLIK